jgi:hypothetical protein
MKVCFGRNHTLNEAFLHTYIGVLLVGKKTYFVSMVLDDTKLLAGIVFKAVVYAIDG